MKKKITIMFTVIFIILICIITINFIRNMIIINSLINKPNSLNFDNFHITRILTVPSQNWEYRNELYIKNNILLLKQYEENDLTTINWKDYNTNEEKAICFNEDTPSFNKELVESILGSIKLNTDITLLQKISYSLLNIINTNKDSFILKDANTKFYYDKSTGLLQKSEGSVGISTYTIEFNNVSEKDVEKPE